MMRDSMKRRAATRTTTLLGLAMSLLMLTMPLGRTMTTVHANSIVRVTQGQQDRSGAASQLAASGGVTQIAPALRSAGTESLSAAEAVDIDASITNYVEEKEANNTPATAQPLTGDNVKVKGNIIPPTDLDYYSFSANAGDRVYTAVMTSFSSNGSDTSMEVFDTNGTTQLENDNNDGSFGTTSSTIAGRTLPATGIYFIRVRNTATTPTADVRPYDLYVRVQKGAPVPESEPTNNSGQALPPSGWVSGAVQSAGDLDYYGFNLNAGDTVWASLDADPERDGVTWNPRLGFEPIGVFNVTIDDATVTAPNSEAYFLTVKTAGTYFFRVDTTGTGSATSTYTLSVSVIAPSDRRCTTYINSTPLALPTGPGLTTSTINIPDNRTISNLQVSFDIQHTSTPDLDVVLTAPAGNDVVLFTDRGTAGAAGSGTDIANFTLDDEAAIPINTMPVLRDLIMQPQVNMGRLGWFKGENAAGTWTLKVYDDLTANGGTLNSWSLTVCEDPPLACPAQLTQSIYSSNFEADTGNFTHSGTLDEWERGTPTGASTPITSCNSGTNCWKTDLDGTYENSSSQDLLSPNINLTGVQGRQIKASWAQKYQMENAQFDHAYVEVREVGNPSNSRRLWEWRDTTQQITATSPASPGGVGNPQILVNMSGGWGIMEYDISEFGGKTVELRFHLDSDTIGVFSGLAVDDVSVTACRLPSRGDFNGNGPADLSVFRPDDPAPGSATWYINANGVVTVQQFGASNDKPVPADYDGDGDVDIAVFRPVEGAWYVSKGSAQNFDRFQWGANGDIPVPGDYDGDGKADFAVFRPADGYWYIHRSSDDGLTARPWGLSTDKPVQADYDGDGKTDIAVFRSGSWFIIQSFTGTVRSLQWGLGTDTPVTGDYDGDRQFDIAVYRPSDGTWYIYQSTTKALRAIQWGIAGDIPVPTDFDADRKTDTVVFRPSDGSWNILRSSDGGFNAAQWGQAGDTPAPRGGVIPD